MPSSTPVISVGPEEERVGHALVRVWSAKAPFRVGEVGFLRVLGRRPAIVGRELGGGDGPTDYVRFEFQRPGGSVPTGPLEGDDLSREHLVFHGAPDGLDVENRGRILAVLVDGHPVEKGGARRIKPGAIIQIAGHSNFLYVRRRETMPMVDVSPSHTFGDPDEDWIAGESPVAWALRADLAGAALVCSHVLLLGESGTGKELCALCIHRRLGRGGLFEAVNLATLEPGIASAELFGGAANFPNHGMPERPGLVGMALGGTLMLDEIGDAPIEIQAKLLRLLQRQYIRIGESRVRVADIIVIGATNRPLDRLKEDLVPRFDVVVLVPSLAARWEDIPLVARAIVLAEAKRNPKLAGPFVKTDTAGRLYVPMQQSFVLAMMRSTFAGNVRDLRKLLLRSMKDTKEGPLRQPADMGDWRVPASLPPPPEDPTIAAEAEDLLERLDLPPREELLGRLERHDWNKTRVGETYRTDRFRISRWMEKLGIKKPKDTEPDDE
jgi:DNA-binding NtrC family response regulator